MRNFDLKLNTNELRIFERRLEELGIPIDTRISIIQKAQEIYKRRVNTNNEK